MNKDMLRSSISYLFTFFIAFFLFVIVLMSSIRFTLMDEGYFLNRMNEVSYYDNTATELNRVIKQNARAAGFEVEAFDDVVKEEDIRDAMISYEKQKLSGEQAEIDTTAFQSNMKTKIQNYIEENSITVNSSVQSALDTFVKTCTEKYSYLTQFPYLDVYGNLMQLYQKVYLIVTPILAVLTCGLCFMISRLYRSRRKRRRQYAYGLIGAGLLVSVAPMVLYATRFFEKINLEPQYMYKLLVSMTRNLLMSNIMIGLLLILSGVLVTYIRIRKKKVKGKSNRTYPSDEMLRNIERE